MDQVLPLLGQLGLGVAANSIFELLKGLATRSVTTEQLRQEIQNRIDLNGVGMRAETVIDALAQNGFIQIRGSNLHGEEGIAFGSVTGGASMGHNTTFTTARTAIKAGTGAFMDTQGNAQVRQNPDGSISFHVGDGGDISFKITDK